MREILGRSLAFPKLCDNFTHARIWTIRVYRLDTTRRHTTSCENTPHCRGHANPTKHDRKRRVHRVCCSNIADLDIIPLNPRLSGSAWLSCLWALTNNVQKRKEKREKKGGFSNFTITQSFLVQFTQKKLQYVQKIHCYNYMHKNNN